MPGLIRIEPRLPCPRARSVICWRSFRVRISPPEVNPTPDNSLAGCRHLFITSLERAGIRPKVAQTPARHSDIRLTPRVYTYADLANQKAAIEAMPSPPNMLPAANVDC
jgi:hypothetical protein